MSKTGYIYKIVSNDINITDIYVGSTQNFRTRKHGHKSSCSNENDKNYNSYVYQFIRDNGGWASFSMIQIEEYKFNTRNELNSRERHWIESLHSTLNKNIPTRTNQEWRDINKDYIKDLNKNYHESHKDEAKNYYENNKDKIKNYRDINKDKIKNYYENNKNKIKEQNKIYRESNKDNIKDKKKIYYESNKDKKKICRESNKDKKKNYYESNKDKILKQQKEYLLKKKNLKFYMEFLDYIYS